MAEKSSFKLFIRGKRAQKSRESDYCDKWSNYVLEQHPFLRGSDAIKSVYYVCIKCICACSTAVGMRYEYVLLIIWAPGKIQTNGEYTVHFKCVRFITFKVKSKMLNMRKKRKYELPKSGKNDYQIENVATTAAPAASFSIIVAEKRRKNKNKNYRRNSNENKNNNEETKSSFKPNTHRASISAKRRIGYIMRRANTRARQQPIYHLTWRQNA